MEEMISVIEGSRKMTEEQMQQAVLLFGFSDADGDGFVTLEEAKAFAARMEKPFEEKH